MFRIECGSRLSTDFSDVGMQNKMSWEAVDVLGNFGYV